MTDTGLPRYPVSPVPWPRENPAKALLPLSRPLPATFTVSQSLIPGYRSTFLSRNFAITPNASRDSGSFTLFQNACGSPSNTTIGLSTPDS